MAVSVAIGNAWNSHAVAQTASRADASPRSTPSHRHLPLPSDGSQDLMRQFQMLQHLQQLVNKQDPSAQEAMSSAGASLDPELLKSLSKLLSPDQKAMFDSIKDQLGDLSQLDAQDTKQLQDSLGEVLREPNSDAMQAKMEELLRKFSQDRQVPPMQGSAFSRPSLPPEGRSGDSRDSNSNGDSPPAEAEAVNGPDANGPDANGPDANGPDANGPSANGSGSEALRLPSGDLASRIAEYFRQQKDSSSGAPRQNDADAESANATPRRNAAGTPRSESGTLSPSNRTEPSREASGPPSSGLSRDRSSQSQNNNLPDLPPRADGSSANLKDVMQRILKSGESAKDLQKLKSEPLDSETLGAGDLPSVPELLKRANEDPTSLPPFDFPENSLDMEDIKKLLAERYPKKKKDDDWLSSLKKQLPNGLKAELHKTGLKDSLADIMEELKNGNVRDGENLPASRSPNMDKLNQESSGPSLGSIQEELGELSSSLSRSDEKKAETPKSSAKDGKTPAKGKQEEKEKGLFASVSGMYDRWMNGPPEIKETDAEEPVADAENAPAGATTTFSVSTEGVLAVVLCLAALFAAYMSMGRKKRSEARALQARAFRSLSISSRSDLVKAFHLMVGATGASTESWWTHRRAAKAVSDLQPSAAPSLEYLNSLYEKARYGPADYQFSEEEYQQARRALEQITAC